MGGRAWPDLTEYHEAVQHPPHAFADPNAFYSRDDRAIFFGYFQGPSNKPIYTCLSHDIVAHETTHAILDGLREDKDVEYAESAMPRSRRLRK